MADKYDVPAILVSWTKSAAARAFKEIERKKMVKDGELVDIELGLGAKRVDTIGGSHLEYVSKTIVRTITLSDQEKRLAILEKSVLMPSPRLAVLKMTEEGLVAADKRIHALDEYWRKTLQSYSCPVLVLVAGELQLLV